MNATTTPARQWRGVFFDGPQSDSKRDGDEEAEPVRSSAPTDGMKFG